MTTSKALEAQLLRCHFVEHRGVNTIAAQLGMHHSTVERVLAQAGLPKAERDQRPSVIDPYLPFIVETLAQFPKLGAARLYAMCQARGFPGGPSPGLCPSRAAASPQARRGLPSPSHPAQ